MRKGDNINMVLCSIITICLVTMSTTSQKARAEKENGESERIMAMIFSPAPLGEEPQSSMPMNSDTDTTFLEPIWATATKGWSAHLSDNGINVLETYESAALVRITIDQLHSLEGGGYRIVRLENTTHLGRGLLAFDTKDGEVGIPENLRLTEPPIEAMGYYVIQFIGPLSERWIATLEGHGVEFLDYLPNYAFIVRMSQAVALIVKDSSFIHFVGLYHPAYKIDPYLIGKSGIFDITITTHKGEPLDNARRFIEVNGGAIHAAAITNLGGVLNAQLQISLVTGLAQLASVSWIEPSGVPYLANDNVRWVVQSGIEGFTPIHDRDIAGQGQIVTVCDTGLDVNHEAFSDPDHPFEYGVVNPNHRKIYYYYKVTENGYEYGDYGENGQKYVGHGTQVSGTVGGDAPVTSAGRDWYTYNKHDGTMFMGKLIMADLYGNQQEWYLPADYDNIFRPGYEVGSHIFTNSWGHYYDEDQIPFEPPGKYTTKSRMADEFTWSHKDALMVWAVGNAGPSTTTIGQESVAKNVISVGGTENGAPSYDPESMFCRSTQGLCSGRGPAGDGRLKPTLLAPADPVCSAKVGTVEEYWCTPGTSNAAPSVAGSAALVRQYFTEGWYPTGEKTPLNGFEPSAVLLKAVLINGASEIFGSQAHDHPYERDGNSMQYPNNDQGWGRLHLWNGVYFSDWGPGDAKHQNLFIVDEKSGLQSGDEVEYLVHVSDRSLPLNITLVWPDYPGTPTGQTTPAIVNNLDLVVTDPNGQSFYGNWFCSTGCSPHQSITGGVSDGVNTEERVVRYAPALGTWRIKVSAVNTDPRHGRQPFALVATGGISNETRQTYTPTSPTEPSIAVDGMGNTHIAFTQDDSGNRNIYYSKLDRDGKVLIEDSLIPANDADGAEQYSPSIVAISQNILFLFFADEKCNPSCDRPVTRTYFLEGWTSTNGGSSWSDLDLNLAGGYVFSSSVGSSLVDRSRPVYAEKDAWGHIHLIWQVLESGGIMETEYLRYSRRNPDGSWIPSKTLVGPDYYSPQPGLSHYNRMRFPKLAVGALSYLHAIYSYDPENYPYPGPPYCQVDCQTYIKYLYSANNGDLWITPSTPLANTLDLGRENTMTADAAGNVYVAWQDKSTPPVVGLDIFLLHSSNNGGNWPQPPQVLADGMFDQKAPWLSVDPGLTLHLTYFDASGSNKVQSESGQFITEVGVCDLKHKVSLDMGQTWHGSRRLSLIYGRAPQSSGCSYLASSSDNAGALHIVWERGGPPGTQNGIHYITAPWDVSIMQTSHSSDSPSLAVDASGRSHIIWLGERESDDDFVSLAKDDSNRLIAMRHEGEVFRSPNAGISWLYKGRVDTETFVALDTDAGARLVALTELGRVYESTNGGSTWVYRHDINSPSVNRIDFRDLDIRRGGSSRHYVLTATGDLYLSTDGGNTWNLLSDVGPDPDFISFDGDTANLYALTEGGRVYYSSTEGAVWDSAIIDAGSFSSIESDSTDTIFALKKSGEVYRRDSGPPISWTLLGDVGAESDYKRLSYGPAGILFVLRDSGEILKSINGGSSWSKSGDAGLDYEIYYSQLDKDGFRSASPRFITTDSDNSDGIDQLSPTLAIRVDPVTGSETLWVFWANQHIDELIPNQITYYLDGARSIDHGATWIPLFAHPGMLFQSDSRTIADRGDMIDVDIDTTGRIHVVFRQHIISTATNQESELVLYTSSSDGTIWPVLPTTIWNEPPYALIGEDHYDKVNWPNIAVGVPGHIHVIFSYDPGMGPYPGPPWCYGGQPDCNTYVKYAGSTNNGNTWTPQPMITTIGLTQDKARENSLKADKTLRGSFEAVYATWHDWKGTTRMLDVCFARSINGGASWLLEQAFNQNNDQAHPDLAVDLNGYLHLVWSGWSSGSSPRYEVFHRLAIDAFQPSGPTWLQERQLTYLDKNSINPCLSVDAEMKLHMVWDGDRIVATRYNIYYLSWL